MESTESSASDSAELIRVAVPNLANGIQPSIVNVTSMTGRHGIPVWPEYSTSKFAFVGLTESLRGEMARFGIAAITIVHGLNKTGMKTNKLNDAAPSQGPTIDSSTDGYRQSTFRSVNPITASPLRRE